MADRVDLGDEIEGYVARLVQAGRYGSRRDVLREGVRLVEERERRLVALDVAVARGVADGDAGRVSPVEDVAARLGVKYRQTAHDGGS